MNIRKLKLHKTAADTWRVLVDGVVHPLLVGFETTDAAIGRATQFFAGQELVFEEPDQDPLVYLPMYAMLSEGVSIIETLRRFLPSELEMTEMSELLHRYNLAPRRADHGLSAGITVDGQGSPVEGRYWIQYNGTKFSFNDYDLESMPLNLREYVCAPIVDGKTSLTIENDDDQG